MAFLIEKKAHIARYVQSNSASSTHVVDQPIEILRRHDMDLSYVWLVSNESVELVSFKFVNSVVRTEKPTIHIRILQPGSFKNVIILDSNQGENSSIALVYEDDVNYHIFTLRSSSVLQLAEKIRTNSGRGIERITLDTINSFAILKSEMPAHEDLSLQLEKVHSWNSFNEFVEEIEQSDAICDPSFNFTVRIMRSYGQYEKVFPYIDEGQQVLNSIVKSVVEKKSPLTLDSTNFSSLIWRCLWESGAVEVRDEDFWVLLVWTLLSSGLACVGGEYVTMRSAEGMYHIPNVMHLHQIVDATYAWMKSYLRQWIKDWLTSPGVATEERFNYNINYGVHLRTCLRILEGLWVFYAALYKRKKQDMEEMALSDEEQALQDEQLESLDHIARSKDEADVLIQTANTLILVINEPGFKMPKFGRIVRSETSSSAADSVDMTSGEDDLRGVNPAVLALIGTEIIEAVPKSESECVDVFTGTWNVFVQLGEGAYSKHTQIHLMRVILMELLLGCHESVSPAQTGQLCNRLGVAMGLPHWLQVLAESLWRLRQGRAGERAVAALLGLDLWARFDAQAVAHCFEEIITQQIALGQYRAGGRLCIHVLTRCPAEFTYLGDEGLSGAGADDFMAVEGSGAESAGTFLARLCKHFAQCTASEGARTGRRLEDCWIEVRSFVLRIPVRVNYIATVQVVKFFIEFAIESSQLAELIKIGMTDKELLLVLKLLDSSTHEILHSLAATLRSIPRPHFVDDCATLIRKAPAPIGDSLPAAGLDIDMRAVSSQGAGSGSSAYSASPFHRSPAVGLGRTWIAGGSDGSGRLGGAMAGAGVGSASRGDFDTSWQDSSTLGGADGGHGAAASSFSVFGSHLSSGFNASFSRTYTTAGYEGAY